MDLDRPQLGKVPDLTGLSGKFALGPTGRRSWLWRFLGICLLATVAGSPARWAGGVSQETSPSAKVQNTWLTAHVSAGATAPTAPTITFGQPPNVTVGTPVPLTASASPPGLPVLFRSDTPSLCTVAGSAVTPVAAGLCTVTASQSGSARYAAAPDVTRSFQENPATKPTTKKLAGALVSLLAAAAVILIAAAAAATLAVRRRRLRPRPGPAPGPSVRAVPYSGPPGLVSVHTTGTGATHTVRIETSPGTSVITIEEARP